jgi:hypothetical protein
VKINVKHFCFLAKFKANVETQQMTIRARDAIIESQKTEIGRLCFHIGFKLC